MKEKAFETQVRNLLNEVGAYHVKYFGCGFSQAGVPDILACLHGWFIAIEVKADRGRPSELQIYNLKLLLKSNGYAILAYPKDLSALREFLTLLSAHKIGQAEALYREVFMSRLVG